MIFIENKKRKIEKLKEQYPDAIIADVTSKSDIISLRMLSPFYPHGDIPVPFSDGYKASCVEAIWQALKVFESADIDIDLLANDTMKNIKRTVRKYGKPLGHRKGIHGIELMDYIDARLQIYLPAYKWMLENKVKNIIDKLAAASKEKDIVLLDYNTNADPFDQQKPLSHASLIKYYVEGKYPSTDSPKEIYKQEQKPKKQVKTRTAKKKNNIGLEPGLFD